MAERMLTDRVVEALRERAKRYGDDFDASDGRVTVRCFDPDKHQNGDAHPSAFYAYGKYIVCPVCSFKAGETKLADLLGIGPTKKGLTLRELAERKKLPEELLADHGLKTVSMRGRGAAVAIPWEDGEGPLKKARAYHLRHYVDKGESDGPRYT